jgi:hypothetical protein
MIIDLHFGYAARHHIYYDTQRKCGTIKLWSAYSGPIIDIDAFKKNEGFLAEWIAHQESQRKTPFRVNQYTEFLIADENDILSILASLVAVINGKEFSFTSEEGRKITLALNKEGKREKEVITVNIQYGIAGRLTIGEAHKLQAIARKILRNLGYLDQEISAKLQNMKQGSPY